MPEESGSRYKSPGFSLLSGMCQLEKPENFSFLAQILFELSQKNDEGGQIDTPPLIRADRVTGVVVNGFARAGGFDKGEQGPLISSSFQL